MWLPCNFLEVIRIRPHIGQPLEEYRLGGLANAPGQKMAYVFYENKAAAGKMLIVDARDDVSFWPVAFSNPDCYDKDSLHDGEIELAIVPNDLVTYNRFFFESKSRAEGKCTGIYYDRKKHKWQYTFIGADSLSKIFYTDELLIRKPFEAYSEDPLLQ